MPSNTSTTKKIHDAIEQKDLDLLQIALNEPDADVNAYDGGFTPLHRAVKADWPAGVEYFLERFDIQPNLLADNEHGHTPLHLAIESCNLWAEVSNLSIESPRRWIVKILLKSPKVNLHIENHHGETALPFAIKKTDSDFPGFIELDVIESDLIESILNHPTFFPSPIEIQCVLVNVVRSRETTAKKKILNCLFSHPRIHQIFENFPEHELNALWTETMIQEAKASEVAPLPSYELGKKFTLDVTSTIAFKILVCSLKQKSHFTFEEAKKLLPGFENLKKATEFFEHSKKMATYPEDFIFLFGFSSVLKLYLYPEIFRSTDTLVLNEGESENDRLIRYGETVFSTPLDMVVQSFYLDEHLPLVERLLKSKQIDINHKKFLYEDPALCVATRAGKVSLVQLLLNQPQIDPMLSTKYDNETPLHLAMRKNHHEIVALLLQHPKVVENIHAEGCAGKSPLHEGVAAGSVEACEVLLESGHFSDLSSVLAEGDNLLHYTASSDRSDEILTLLLKKEQITSEMLDAKDHNGQTPLNHALNKNRIELFKFLIFYLKFGNKPLAIDTRETIPDPETDPKAFFDFLSTKNGHQIKAYCIAESLLKNDPNLTCEEIFANFNLSKKDKQTAFQHALRAVEDPAADLFALTVFLCKGLLQLKDVGTPLANSVLQRKQRFFGIMKKLPMDLQMIMCHTAFDSSKESISSKAKEDAFQGLALKLK